MGVFDAEWPTPFDAQIGLGLLYAVTVSLYLVGLPWFVWRGQTSDVIRMRSPWAVVLTFTLLWCNVGLDQVANIWQHTLFCDAGDVGGGESGTEYRTPSTGFGWFLRILLAVDVGSLIGVIALAVWRAVRLIVKFEATRIRWLIQLKEEGFVDSDSVNANPNGNELNEQPAAAGSPAAATALVALPPPPTTASSAQPPPHGTPKLSITDTPAVPALQLMPPASAAAAGAAATSPIAGGTNRASTTLSPSGAGGPAAPTPMSQASVALHSTSSDTKNADQYGSLTDVNFFVRYMWYFDSVWFDITVAVYVLIVPIIRLAVPPDFLNDQGQCRFQDLGQQAALGLLAILLGVLAVKMRTLRDGFYLKSELSGIAALLQVLVQFVVITVHPPFDQSIMSNVWSCVLIGGVWIPTIARPLYHTYYPPRGQAMKTEAGLKATAAAKYRHTKEHSKMVSRIVSTGAGGNGRSQEAIPYELTTLPLLLQHKAARQCFREHLMLEFAIESLLFYDEVSAYRALDPATLTLTSAKHRAHAIYRKFIAPGSPFEINVSSETKLALHTEFKPHQLVKRKQPQKHLQTLSPGAAAHVAAANANGNGSDAPSGLGYRRLPPLAGGGGSKSLAGLASALASASARKKLPALQPHLAHTATRNVVAVRIAPRSLNAPPNAAGGGVSNGTGNGSSGGGTAGGSSDGSIVAAVPAPGGPLSTIGEGPSDYASPNQSKLGSGGAAAGVSGGAGSVPASVGGATGLAVVDIAASPNAEAARLQFQRQVMLGFAVDPNAGVTVGGGGSGATTPNGGSSPRHSVEPEAADGASASMPKLNSRPASRSQSGRRAFVFGVGSVSNKDDNGKDAPSAAGDSKSGAADAKTPASGAVPTKVEISRISADVAATNTRTIGFYLSIFDRAQAEILQLMEQHSFARFVHTTAYSQLIEKVQVAQQLQAEQKYPQSGGGSGGAGHHHHTSSLHAHNNHLSAPGAGGGSVARTPTLGPQPVPQPAAGSFSRVQLNGGTPLSVSASSGASAASAASAASGSTVQISTAAPSPASPPAPVPAPVAGSVPAIFPSQNPLRHSYSRSNRWSVAGKSLT